MKKILVILSFSFFMASCSGVKNYVTFSGKVKGVERISLSNKKAHVDKTIAIKPDGSFRDTLKLKKPSYLALSDGEQKTVVFFKNGDDIQMLLDVNKIDHVTFKGKGSEESAYMAKKNLMQKKFFKDSLYYKSQSQFDNKLSAYSQVFKEELAKATDSTFKAKQTKYIKSFQKRAKKQYKFKSYLIKNLGKGTPTPDFSYPYEDKEGKQFTLKDLKGKHAYIKLWATWCAYCKKEAPDFKKLAKEYKEINFVGVSFDKERSKKLWKKMVDKSSDVTELFSKDDRGFKKAYKIKDLPRFLLIDAEGKIIDADAPLPSSPEIKGILNSLK